MQENSSDQDRSSLCVWLVPHIDPESRVLWAWAEDVIFFLPDPSRIPDSPHMTAEARASAERELQRLQLQSEVLHPGEVPLLDADYEQAGDPEDIAGRRLLREQPERLVRGFIRVHQTDTPNQWHYQAANAALVREGLDVETNIDTRNELAMALHRECRRVIVPDGAGLAELNAIATDAVERVSGRPEEQLRKAVEARPFFWWAESVPDRGANQIRWPRALAQELHRRNRKLRAGLPRPLMTLLIRSGVERPELASDGRLQHRADDGTTRAAAAQVHLAERALGDTAPPGVVPLAAYLATVCYQQHRLGLDEASAKSVAIPSTSRDSLRPFGIETPAELRAALDWLQATSIGDPRFDLWTCVTGHGQAGDGRRSSAKGGRPPRPGYVVDVGYPLAPFAASRLRDTFAAHGMTPPPSLGFFAPVLPVELAPPAAPNSYGPTRKRQLDAYCMALPLVLMERREEYAERGILLDDLRAPLRKVGIYSRGKGDTSLFDSLSDVWMATPEPALFTTRTSPVLVPVEPGSTRYRLGPDYADADGMIVDAAGFTEQQRKVGKTGRDKLMMRRTKR